MIAGAVFRYVTQSDARFYQMFRPRITLWQWGEEEKPRG